MTPRELTNEIVKILDKKKALDITAIKTEELTIVSDYFVIATGTSNTHVKSLADDLEYEMGKLGAAPEHIEGRATGWILLDFGRIQRARPPVPEGSARILQPRASLERRTAA